MEILFNMLVTTEKFINIILNNSIVLQMWLVLLGCLSVQDKWLHCGANESKDPKQTSEKTQTTVNQEVPVASCATVYLLLNWKHRLSNNIKPNLIRITHISICKLELHRSS